MLFQQSIYRFLISLPKNRKRMLIYLLDIGLASISVLLSLKLNGKLYSNSDLLYVFSFFISITIFSSLLTGLYRVRLFGFTLSEIRTLAKTAVLIGFFCILLRGMFLEYLSSSVLIIFALIFFVLALLSRIAALSMLRFFEGDGIGLERVIIYGAGSAGIQLLSALKGSKEFKPVAIVDDKISLQGLKVSGFEIQSPSELAEIIENISASKILIAIPSLTEERRKEIARQLQHLDCNIHTMPSYPDLISGGSLASSLEKFKPESFLVREDISSSLPNLKKMYRGENILITGAGGSIGSELSKQVLSCSPKTLVLFDQSEFSLYKLEGELRGILQGSETKLILILGSVTDKKMVSDTLLNAKISIIFHAAAYKHVPIVENNEIEGIKNNVLGTNVLSDLAVKYKVAKFILISSDKAVRPTNVMGATKRLSELVIQKYGDELTKTTFSAVRFGNVMGSSGSVIPLFKSQIESGGPLTITDKRATRFFMTIQEATRLVLLAGSYCEGGDLFILDMGKPVKILDLATRMIKLYGLKVRSGNMVQEKTIQIEEVGLRPGEKLHEELLIGSSTLPTPHPKILRAEEPKLKSGEVEKMLIQLDFLIENGNGLQARNFIKKWVPEYVQK